MKQKLSKELKKLLTKKGLSVYGLSEELGIERTTLQKFLSGSRNMSPDIFRLLLKTLNLPQEKCLELYDLFERESMGELVYQEHQKFLEINKEFNHFQKGKGYSLKSSKMMFDYEIDNLSLKFVDGNAHILTTIENLFIREMKKEKDAHVIMSLHWDYAILDQLMIRMDHADLSGGLIQNIIPIVNKKNVDNNLDVLKSVFYLGCLNCLQYEPYYYYTSSKKDDQSVIFPNYFITSSNLLLIDQDFKSAVVIDRQEVINFYKNKALEIIADARPLVKKSIIEGAFSKLDSFVYKGYDQRVEYIHAQVAIDFLKAKNPEMKAARQELFHRFLPEDDREADVFLLRDQYFSSENLVQFMFSEDAYTFDIVFECEACQKIISLTIEELGIVKSFQDFIKYLPKSTYVYSQEEIQKWFKKTP
ncbi:helix-turn-helix domain-containing protein [Eubacteriaceae bacterium ES2]|nr:helix-turn-helix domain-containing protein [Eubacteriaceae bacterium ES2]